MLWHSLPPLLSQNFYERAPTRIAPALGLGSTPKIESGSLNTPPLA